MSLENNSAKNQEESTGGDHKALENSDLDGVAGLPIENPKPKLSKKEAFEILFKEDFLDPIEGEDKFKKIKEKAKAFETVTGGEKLGQERNKETKKIVEEKLEGEILTGKEVDEYRKELVIEEKINILSEEYSKAMSILWERNPKVKEDNKEEFLTKINNRLGLEGDKGNFALADLINKGCIVENSKEAWFSTHLKIPKGDGKGFLTFKNREEFWEEVVEGCDQMSTGLAEMRADSIINQGSEKLLEIEQEVTKDIVKKAIDNYSSGKNIKVAEKPVEKKEPIIAPPVEESKDKSNPVKPKKITPIKLYSKSAESEEGKRTDFVPLNFDNYGKIPMPEDLDDIFKVKHEDLVTDEDWNAHMKRKERFNKIVEDWQKNNTPAMPEDKVKVETSKENLSESKTAEVTSSEKVEIKVTDNTLEGVGIGDPSAKTEETVAVEPAVEDENPGKRAGRRREKISKKVEDKKVDTLVNKDLDGDGKLSRVVKNKKNQGENKETNINDSEVRVSKFIKAYNALPKNKEKREEKLADFLLSFKDEFRNIKNGFEEIEDGLNENYAKQVKKAIKEFE